MAKRRESLHDQHFKLEDSITVWGEGIYILALIISGLVFAFFAFCQAVRASRHRSIALVSRQRSVMFSSSSWSGRSSSSRSHSLVPLFCSRGMRDTL